MTLNNRMTNKLGTKAIAREFEVLYALYHHESLAKDEIPHHLHYPECNWLETTLDDLECMNLITSHPTKGWIYEITDKGKVLMRDELLRPSKWYVYKAYLITTEASGLISLYDAANAFHDFEDQGVFEDFEP